jgi:hypothetical protein
MRCAAQPIPQDPWSNPLSLDYVEWNPRVSEWRRFAQMGGPSPWDGPAESPFSEAAGDVHDGSDDEGEGAGDRG